MTTSWYLKFKLNSSVYTVVCWVMTSYNVVSGYQFVGETRCILEIEAVHCSETFVSTCQHNTCWKLHAKWIINLVFLSTCPCYHTFFYHSSPLSSLILFPYPLISLFYTIYTLISFPNSTCSPIPSTLFICPTVMSLGSSNDALQQLVGKHATLVLMIQWY